MLGNPRYASSKPMDKLTAETEETNKKPGRSHQRIALARSPSSFVSAFKTDKNKHVLLEISSRIRRSRSAADKRITLPHTRLSPRPCLSSKNRVTIILNVESKSSAPQRIDFDGSSVSTIDLSKERLEEIEKEYDEEGRLSVIATALTAVAFSGYLLVKGFKNFII